MPGRYEAIESVWNQVRKETVSAIVCLAEKDEIHEKSAQYAQALFPVGCSLSKFLTVARLRTVMLSGR